MKIQRCFQAALAVTTLSGCVAFNEEEQSREVTADEPSLTPQATKNPCPSGGTLVAVDAINGSYDKNKNGSVCRIEQGKRIRWHDDKE